MAGVSSTVDVAASSAGVVGVVSSVVVLVAGLVAPSMIGGVEVELTKGYGLAMILPLSDTAYCPSSKSPLAVS